MRCIALILLSGVTLAGLSAAPLNDLDRSYALSALHASRKQFLDAVAGLNQAQLNYKPGPDRRSIAEIAEHVALSEETIFQGAMAALQQPAREPLAQAHALDEKIIATVPDRAHKLQAPAALVPHHAFATTADAVAAFKKLRDQHIAYVRDTNDALREHIVRNPVLGQADALHLILLMSAHTERHVEQILEVKAAPGFPQ
jgi:hypothetical protein